MSKQNKKIKPLSLAIYCQFTATLCYLYRKENALFLLKLDKWLTITNPLPKTGNRYSNKTAAAETPNPYLQPLFSRMPSFGVLAFIYTLTLCCLTNKKPIEYVH
jgi:hypothetical protein